jgi:hypothetical protein
VAAPLYEEDGTMTIILDIGCGIRPQKAIPGTTICCEPCPEYAAVLASRGLIVVNATWGDAVDLFLPLSVDHVTLFDVIEHLPKDEALRLLERTLSLARVAVHVYTPEGFVEQGPAPDGTDAWGLHGGEWQRHRSGWSVDDFPGWDVERVQVRTNPPALKATWTRKG